MIKKFGTIALFILSISAFAQTETAPATMPAKRYARPDIPGTFAIEIAVNNSFECPSKFDLGFWGSRTLNFYYQYDMRILKSNFSFVPAIGFSLERYKFRNNFAPKYYNDGDSVIMADPGQYGLPGIDKSMLITNFVEVPLELKYSTRPDDPGRSFKASIGGRIGFLFDSFAKVKYREDGETKKIKDKQNFNLNTLRYSVFAKIGVGNVSLVAYYNLSTLFEEGKGMRDNGVITNDFNTWTVGFSFASF